jgi:hypothetical protein
MRTSLFCIFLAILGALLFYRIEDRPLASIEANIVSICEDGPVYALRTSSRQGRPPLFPFVCGFANILFGMEGAAFRYVAAFSGLLTLWPVYRLTRRATRLGSYSALACLALALSPFWIQLSRLARPESLAAFLAATSTFYLFEALRTPRTKYWGRYAVLLGLLLYTSHFALALIIAHGAAAYLAARAPSAEFHEKHASGLGFAWISALGAYAPWAALALYRLIDRGPGGLSVFNALEITQHAGLSAGYTVYMFTFGDSVAPWNALRAVLLTLPCLTALCFGLDLIFRRFTRMLPRLMLCGLVCFAISLASISVLFNQAHPYLVPIWLAFLFPFHIVAVAYGFGAMRKGISIPLLAVFLAANLYSLRNYWLQREHTNWDFAAPAAEILEAIESRFTADCLLLIDTYNLKQIDYYWHGGAAKLDLREARRNEAGALESFDGRNRVLFVYATDRKPGGRGIRALRDDFALIETVPFLIEPPAINEIKSYVVGRPVPVEKILLEVYERKPSQDASATATTGQSPVGNAPFQPPRRSALISAAFAAYSGLPARFVNSFASAARS